jgi:hypothetical protein
MNNTNTLLARLDAIGKSLQESSHALALIGLGSVGIELERLDIYSDLDFFAIVEEGFKSHYIENLGWLSQIYPIAYRFRNTPDGYKLLFEDGIFCEFAVFEISELGTIPFTRGRIIWKQPYIEESILMPSAVSASASEANVARLVGETITNLYVGVGRFRRGEKLSAARFIQQYAVDRILELSALLEKEQSTTAKDIFSPERRFEQRFPNIAQQLPNFIQGYEYSVESAQAILAFLEENFEVNPAIANATRQLCTDASKNM